MKYERPLRTCFECSRKAKAAKKVDRGYICHKCYKPPKNICSICKEEKIIQSKKGGLNYCQKCYVQPHKKCKNCGEISKIRGYELCDKCYKYKQTECSRCKNRDRVAKLENNKPICKRCYDQDWLQIENNRLKQLIRKRIRDALHRKINKKDYNIFYENIINYLGSKPNGDYHIDHIFPLCAFDFNDPKQIEKAFAPENHQWLESSENLKKYNKYDKEAFKAYINKE